MSEQVRRRGLFRARARVALSALLLACAVAYPLIVYFGLTRAGTRFSAWLLIALTLAHTVFRSRELRRLAWRSALPLPLCAAALYLDDRRYMLAVPVLINAVLFSTFFGSLWSERPLVERFARMRVRDLSGAEVAYCRGVTKLWSGFFVLNGATAGGLAVAGALDAWTLYTGLISYILVGIVGASEYTVRKYRFGRFGHGLHDRILRALLPSRPTPP